MAPFDRRTTSSSGVSAPRILARAPQARATIADIWSPSRCVSSGSVVSTTSGRLKMGPRGGDELNLLLPGRNYGWPFREGLIEGPWEPPASTCSGCPALARITPATRLFSCRKGVPT